MVTGEKTIQTIVGKVTQCNRKGTGFKLDVCPNDWFNFSTYSEHPDLGMPQVGAMITVECTAGARGGYWIQDWRPAYEHANQTGYHESYLSPEVRAVIHTGEVTDDKPIVTRLACLNAAIAFWGDDSDRREEIIIRTAEVFVAWAKGASILDAHAVNKPLEASAQEQLDLDGLPSPMLSDFQL